jgi:hypothetical protein
VLWNRDYFVRFRFRFRLLKSNGSGSKSDFWKVMVLVPNPTFEKLWFWFRFRFHNPVIIITLLSKTVMSVTEIKKTFFYNKFFTLSLSVLPIYYICNKNRYIHDYKAVPLPLEWFHLPHPPPPTFFVQKFAISSYRGLFLGEVAWRKRDKAFSGHCSSKHHLDIK